MSNISDGDNVKTGEDPTTNGYDGGVTANTDSFDSDEDGELDEEG